MELRADKTLSGENDPLAGISLGASALTIFFIFLVGATGTLAVLSVQSAEPLALTIMGLLATFGAFSVFAIAAGHVRIAERYSETDIAAALTDQLEAGCLLTTPDGRVLYANRPGRSLLGRNNLGEINSLEDALATTPQGAEMLFRLVRAAQRGQNHVEVYQAQGDHNVESVPTFYRLSVKPFGRIDVADHAGQSILWTIENITEERRARDLLTSSLEAELSHVSAMPAGFLSIAPDGTIGYLNPLLSHWLGHGKDAPKPLSHVSHLLASQDAELLATLAAQPESGRQCLEIDFVTADGGKWPATCILTSETPANATQPAGLKIIVHSRDSIRRSAAGDAPLDMEIGDLFRAAPFGLALVDRKGVITRNNPAFGRLMRHLKLHAGEATIDSLIRDEDSQAREQLKKALTAANKGKAEIQPIDIVLGDDGEFARRIYIQGLQTGAKSHDIAIAYVTDATEERTLGHKFAQSQKMEAVGKLAGGIAHDFNNVLTAIIGFSDLLLASHRPSDHAYKNIQNIRSSANHAAGLVKQLLAFSRRQTLEPELLQLNEVVTDLSVILNRLLGENIELKISSGRELWAVKADHNQLNQVVINLAVNARDAMPDGGRLIVRTRNVTERECLRLADQGMPVGQYVLIEVEDTGIGMAPDVMQKIFEPFFTTKDIGKGTGLGLSTVYGIIKQTGGYVFADSEIGQGTTFRVYLPRHELPEGHEQDLAKKVDKKDRPVDLTGHGRVLVVEDEDAVRIFATEALRRQGYEVLQACDGLDALDVMEDNDYDVDLVVSDVKMPEMDGPTLFKELRQHKPDLKFVFVSGYTDDAFTKTLDEDAEYTFLPKPYTLAQIAEVVKDQLR